MQSIICHLKTELPLFPENKSYGRDFPSYELKKGLFGFTSPEISVFTELFIILRTFSFLNINILIFGNSSGISRAISTQANPFRNQCTCNLINV